MGKIEITKVEDYLKLTPQGALKKVQEKLSGLLNNSPEDSRIHQDTEVVISYISKLSKEILEEVEVIKVTDYPLAEFISNLDFISKNLVRSREDLGEGEFTRWETLLWDYSRTIKAISEKREGVLFVEEDSNKVDYRREIYILQSRSNLIHCLMVLDVMCQGTSEEIQEENDPEIIKRIVATRDEAQKTIIPSIKKELAPIGPDTSLEELQRIYNWGKAIIVSIVQVIENNLKELEEYEKNNKVSLSFSSEDPVKSKEKKGRRAGSKALAELEKIARETKSKDIQVSKDLWKSHIHTNGDTLILARTEEERKDIEEKQKKGQLLAGTLEGLSGGTAQLKIFTIALAQTLNEQSKYHKTEEDWSGIPKDLIPSIMGQDVEVGKRESVKINGERREYPYILVSYTDMAKKISKNGKTSGGKDAQYIKDYIQELSRKEYLISGENEILGIPFLVKEVTIYSKSTGKEVGCLLRLSPQFSRYTKGYIGLRADTIQLLGGGKQKEITMDLLYTLLENRGYKNGVYTIYKNNLLAKYRNIPKYINKSKGSVRWSVIEKDYKEAIGVVMNLKLISKYKEEIKPSGEILCIFTYSKDYLDEDSTLADNQ